MISEEYIIELYQSLQRELYIYIYRLIGSRETAEDILHDCFLNLIKYSRKHEIREQSVRAFLYRTAHNLSVNYLKRRGKIDIIPLENDAVVVEDNPATALAYKELNQAIHSLLKNVDEVSRSIYIMKKELDLSLDEIAAHTGKSERTVRRRLKGVLAYLSDSLKKSGHLMVFIYVNFMVFGCLIG
jgi:RNA polymerase sigma factor (sigma-70 family)